MVEPASLGAAAVGVVRGHDVVAACLLHGHVVVAPDDAGDGPVACSVMRLARQDHDVPVDAGHPDPVVPDGPDRPGGVRAVAGVVDRIGVAVDRIDAIAVVDVSVAVVVHARCAVALSRVEADVRDEVRVVIIDAGIDVGNQDRGVARC